ncbi:SwmB domain-containing protein [Microcystis wesenbergii]|uniref:SwmB domain-containing protein n=1 Tax=Microcystis wesenbergii NRERC-220 TaxID=3068991 RepID=A0ABU3HPQ0_9CHRO|nr:SwmB domain-containing protein [Microcystis wesenbergii]MDT3676517.1 SwmB domain-containing protein [Microcystis wesenbergii NRERC-220]
MSINLASSLSAITTDSTTGVTHIVWADNGNIWHAVYDNNSETWKNAEAIAFTGTEPVTSLNLVASGQLIDSSNPGLAVVWQQGNLNDSDFFYTAAQYDENADLQWLDTPQTLTSDQVGDLEPTVTVNDSGEVIVIGSKVNFDNVANLSIKEDTDFYTQTFSVSSSQFSTSTSNVIPTAPYSPQLTNNGVVNPGVLSNAQSTTPAGQSATKANSLSISSDETEEEQAQQPFGSWNAQLYFASSLLKDWELMNSVPSSGFLRSIIKPFLENFELVGTLSGGTTFGGEPSIFLQTNAQLEWESPKELKSPWKNTTGSEPTVDNQGSDIFGNLFADDTNIPSASTATKIRGKSPITFGFDLDSKYSFSNNSPYDLLDIDNVLGITASVKFPIIPAEETAGFFTLDATGSVGINFNLLGTPIPGQTYSPQTLLAGLGDLGKAIGSGAGADAYILLMNLAKEGTTEGSGAGILAADIAIAVGASFAAFINGTTQGLDNQGSISFPVLTTGVVGKAQIPHVPILSADINGGVETAFNFGIGNTDNTISLTFPVGLEVKIGPLGLGFNFNPGWSWNVFDGNKNSSSDSDSSSVASSASLALMASTTSASLAGSLITVDFGTNLAALPSASDFTVSVTDINGNITNVPVFGVVAGASSNLVILQLENAIPTSENLDYTSSDNPTPTSNNVSLNFVNNEGIKDTDGNTIENISDLGVTNNTPNSLAYQYNPTSGNSQNYINPTLLLAFNTPLDTTVSPDLARFTVKSGSTVLSITDAKVTNNGVLLTFASSVTNQSLQNVTISYNNSSSLGSNPLEDSNGDLIESFTIQNGVSAQVSQSSVFISNNNSNLTFSDTVADYTVTVTNSDGTTVNDVQVQSVSVSLTGNNVFLSLNQSVSPDQIVSITYNSQNISSLVTGITPPAVTTSSLIANIEADLGQDNAPFIISGGSSPLLAWVAEVPPLEPISGFVNGELVTLNFIDDLGNGTDVPTANQFIVTDSDGNTYTVTNVKVNDNSLTLTLGTAVSGDTQLNLSYNLSNPTSNNTNLYIDNSFTNTTLWVNEFSNFALTNTTNSSNPPVILGAGAIVENNTSNQITLVFDQSLTDNGVTNSDFTVESNGQVFTILGNVNTTGNTVILTVQPPEGVNLIGNGDIVTVSYTGNSLSGTNGSVANFSNQPVITSPSTPTTVIKYALLNSADTNLVSSISSIPGTGGFNFNPVGAYDSTNDITVLVWSNADASDINANLVPGEFYTDNETTLINESFNQSDVYYSIYSGGSWTVAAAIAQQEGSEGKIVIGSGPNNELMAAWINYNNKGESNIYWSSLTYNSGEASWSSPEILYTDANPDPSTELSIVTINGKPTVLWTETQATSYSQLTQEESPLLYYRLAETSGTTLVNEGIYGAGGNGTYSGSVTFNQVGALENTSTNQGDPNPAVLFNAGDSATSVAIPFSGISFSLEFWFKAPSLSSSSIELLSVSDLVSISLTNTELSFNLNGNILSSGGFTPSANQWYYVVASYDGETDTATLYINGQPSVSQENLALTLPNSATVSLASASNTSAVYLDEVAFYSQALTYSETGNISDFGNLTPSQISQILFNTSQIGNKYNSQYIAPLPAGPNTNYVTYNGSSWSVPSVIDPTYEPIATQLSNANKPEWDVTSYTTANSSGYVNPNGNPDIYLPLNLSNQTTGKKITSIVVTATNSNGDTITWSVGNTTGYQLAVVQGDKLLNPVNPDGSFEYTILSSNVDLDLFIDGGGNNYSNFNYSINGNTPQSITPGDVTSQPTTINSNQVLGTATVTEANDSSLALIDSGFIINTNNPSIGYSILYADFNNDGKSDVAVGNRGYTNTSGVPQSGGTIQILFGGQAVLLNSETNPLTTTDLTGNPNGVLITGLSDTGQANGDFPFSMATGDVNGDGYQDLVIGDPNANAVYVVYGSNNLEGTSIDVTNLTSSQGYVINAPSSTNIAFGYSVAVGNFNSNAQSNGTYASGTKFDIAIGAPGANNGNGAVYVAFDGSSTYSTIYNSTNQGELAGYSLAVSSRTPTSTTFTNNQFSDDLIIGAINFQGTVTNQWTGLDGLPSNTNQNNSYPSTTQAELGAVYVYQSNGTTTLTQYVSYTGPNLPSSNGTPNNINAGSALNSSDLDGDSINDLAISAPGASNNNGVVYVLKGGVSANSNYQNLGNVSNLGIVGGLLSSQTGAVITSPGDVNDDGYADFLITAPQGANGTGQGYVLFGPLDLGDIGTIFDLNITATDSKTTFLLNGDQPYQLVGAAASGIGDVNGDKVDDLMISAPNAGQLYTIYGHPWLADDGSIKLADISGDNGFVIDGDLYSVAVGTQIYNLGDESSAAPAFINNNGTFYLAYVEKGGNQIYLTTSSDAGQTWTSAVELPSGITTSQSPSLAFYKGTLYLAYVGTNKQINITSSTDNGQSWSSQYSIDQFSSAGVSLVEYQGQLMAFFVSTESNSDILYVYSDNPQSGASWSTDYTVPNPGGGNQTASQAVSATVMGETLYLAYRGGTVGSGNNYYVTNTSGSNLTNLTWSVSELSGATSASTAPGITNDGSQLYFTYSNSSSDLYYLTSSNGTSWSGLNEIDNQTSNYLPAPAILGGRLYLGYTGTDSEADVYVTALSGSQILLGAGNDVVMLGDINGDGFADVLAGGTINGNGAVVTFGSSTQNLLDAAAGTDELIINISNSGLIQSVASAGDFNGDGLADFGVVDQNNNFYLILGNTNLGPQQTLSLSTSSNTSLTEIGDFVAVGDYNGDGYDDLLLSSSNGGQTLYKGNSSGALNSSVTFSANSNTVFNGIGDVNGDGFGDIGGGDPNGNVISPNATGNGQATVYLGNGSAGSASSNSTNITPPSAAISGTLNNSDWSFNSLDDTPVFSPSFAVFNGYLYMVYNTTEVNPITGIFTYNFYIQRSADGYNWEGLTSLGSSFESVSQASLAVFNNTLYLAFTATNNLVIVTPATTDSSSDLGLTFDSTNSINAGGNKAPTGIGPTLAVYDEDLYLFFAANNSTQTILYTTSSDGSTWSSNGTVTNSSGNAQETDNRLGVAVDGDNLLVSFVGNGNKNVNVATYNGTSWSSNQVSGQTSSSGPSLLSVGDTLYLFFSSGNSNDQILYLTSTDGGSTWSSTLNNIPSQTTIDRPSPVFFQESILVGYATTGTTRIGIATSNPIYEPNQTQQFGEQLQNIGDFNGDGIADFAVLAPGFFSNLGSWNNNLLENNQGAVLIFYGSTSGLSSSSTPDVVLATPAPTASTNVANNQALLLTQVAPTGDINGDGYDDLIIASPNTALDSSNTTDGTAFVVFGGGESLWGSTYSAKSPFDLNSLSNNQSNSSTGNSNTSGFVITGLPASQAGISLSGGGDVNGDGFSDFIIGAPGDADNLTYVIFGSDFNETVTQTGTIGDDSMIGTATGESFLAGEGDDQIYTNGGIDVVYGGPGDDFVTVNDTYFRRLDGGTGTDVLRFEGYNGQDWDLTTLSPGSRLRNFEILVTEGYGANTLTLNSLTVTQLSDNNTVTVVMDANDTLSLSSDFSLNNGTVYQYNQKFDQYTSNTSAATVLLNRIVQTGTTNVITVTKNAPTKNIPTPNSTLEVASVSAETMTSYSVGESGDSTAGSFASAVFSPTASNPNAPTRIFVSNPKANEADGKVEFTIQRTGDLDKYVWVDYLTQDGGAKAGNRYTPVAGQAVFAPGETTLTVTVPIPDNGKYVGKRKFGLAVTLEGESSDPNLVPDAWQAAVATPNEQIRRWKSINGTEGNSVVFDITSTNSTDRIATFDLDLDGLVVPVIWNPATDSYVNIPFANVNGISKLQDVDGNGLNDLYGMQFQDGGPFDGDEVVNGLVALDFQLAQLKPVEVPTTGGRIAGTEGNNYFNAQASSGTNRLEGLGGIDVLVGSPQRDVLLGGADNDQLFGYGEVDQLFGQAGNDILDGGKGLDLLYGGTGADNFVLRAGDGSDQVMDFNATEGDLFVLENLSFGALSFNNNQILSGTDVLASVTNAAGQPVTDFANHPQWFVTIVTI